MLFHDRTSAGKILAESLARYKCADAVVLALARGGVPVGAEIARKLMLPMDVLVPKKIGHPFSSAFAICVVDDRGALLCNDGSVDDVDKHWLLDEIRKGEKEAKKCQALYRGKRERLNITGKTVIIVDDGAATGLTLRVALMSAERERPKQMVIAVPVIPQETKKMLMRYADVVTISEPRISTDGVGGFYEDFSPVSDEDVLRILRNVMRRSRRISVSLRSRWLRLHASPRVPAKVIRSPRAS